MGNFRKRDSTSKRGQKRLTVGLIVVLLVVIVAALIYFFGIKSHSSNNDQDSVRTEQKQSHAKKSADADKSDSHPKQADGSGDLASQAKKLMATDLGSLGGTTSAYFYDLSSKQTAAFGADKPQRAASDIKLFIMATVYQNVNDGKFVLSEKYALKDSDKVGGSGALQGMAANTQVSYQDLLKYMMTQSDNTASNILLEKVGGISAVNDEIKKLGLSNTVMKRKLMDTEKLAAGEDNMTTAENLGEFLTKLYHHQVVSESADTAMMQLLSQNTNHSKLPAQVSSDVKIYNKTGEFGEYGVQNDATIMEKGGKAFVITVMSQDGTEATQKAAMAKLGSDLSQLVFK